MVKTKTKVPVSSEASRQTLRILDPHSLDSQLQVLSNSLLLVAASLAPVLQASTSLHQPGRQGALAVVVYSELRRAILRALCSISHPLLVNLRLEAQDKDCLVQANQLSKRHCLEAASLRHRTLLVEDFSEQSQHNLLLEVVYSEHRLNLLNQLLVQEEDCLEQLSHKVKVYSVSLQNQQEEDCLALLHNLLNLPQVYLGLLHHSHRLQVSLELRQLPSHKQLLAFLDSSLKVSISS